MTKSRWAIIALLLACLSEGDVLWAQSARSQGRSTAVERTRVDTATGVIRGTVLRRDNRKPIPKARVTAIGPLGTFVAVADAAGRYEINTLAPGDYLVAASTT